MDTQTLHKFTIMRGGKPEVLSYDPSNEAAVAEAAEKFTSLRGEGYLAVKTDGTTGQPTEQTNEFDPEAHNIVFTQPFAGGRG